MCTDFGQNWTKVADTLHEDLTYIYDLWLKLEGTLVCINATACVHFAVGAGAEESFHNWDSVLYEVRDDSGKKKAA